MTRNYCFTHGFYEFPQKSRDFREIPKYMMLPFHNFNRLNKLSFSKFVHLAVSLD